MIRENSRERNSHSFGGFKAGKDYRESLFSIFVDNLNPVVDSVGLWGMFKPFGKVRGVFLSAKNESRCSCYAFIQFGSREEASKVAKMVNGMHIYGWPITAKIAYYGWNKRRFSINKPAGEAGKSFIKNKAPEMEKKANMRSSQDM
ncbi:hypothetical protein LWI29_025165 [Acer saccharum]|uniref:RRM domain-containing protein n=1 Tax=Acer saccharum TaxID=4024 RepID=A0AA39W2V4_ACESA|nr:hypothetical protein LWI29_025165 [Acer saccharum]